MSEEDLTAECSSIQESIIDTKDEIERLNNELQQELDLQSNVDCILDTTTLESNEAQVPAPEYNDVWGAHVFMKSIVSRLQSKQVLESLELRAKHVDKDWSRLPNGWNIALLGPTGAGKSSLIYTLWRTMNNIKTLNPNSSYVVESLEVGWTIPSADMILNADESSSQAPSSSTLGTTSKAPQAKHGTKVLASITVQEASDKCGYIKVQDTKGQQFFDKTETEYADRIVSGLLEEGSTIEKQSLRYWITMGSMGFFQQSNADTSPHVVLMVFDASLKSLQKILNVDFSHPDWKNKVPQLVCYHAVLDAAARAGLHVHVALTHVDVMEARGGFAGKSGRVGEELQEEIDSIVMKLSASLSYGDRNLPVSHIFVIENYREDKFAVDSRIELAAAELVDALIESADDFLLRSCPRKKSCIIS